MTPVEREAARQQAQLTRIETAATRHLAETYAGVLRRLTAGLGEVTRMIAAERAAGREPSVGWLYRQARFSRLIEEVEREITRFLPTTDAAIRQAQRAALDLVAGHTGRLTQLALGPAPERTVAEALTGFSPLQAQALEAFAGYTSAGTPLRALLASLPSTAASDARDVLAFGVAAGRGPRATAAAFRQVVDVPLHRALTIARTETLKAYSAASLETYRRNSDVIAGWTWHANLDRRTCAACWAMHGTEHSLEETLDRHPCCRCVMIPQTRSWAELGFPGVAETREPIVPGVDRFAALSEADKLAVLGRAKLEAYNSGAITLPDLVARPVSPVWGSMRREASLREALAG